MSPLKPMIDSVQRGAYDDLNTPFEALRYLLPYLPKPPSIIWESAPGEGKLVDMMVDNGLTVTHTNRDYFEFQPLAWDVQVTNPPFSIKAKWLQRANELAKPYAILLPVTALGARNCQLQMGGTELLFLPRRIDFTGKKAPWFAVMWVTKGLNLPSPINFVDSPLS